MAIGGNINISKHSDGEFADASTLNRPVIELDENIKDLENAIESEHNSDGSHKDLPEYIKADGSRALISPLPGVSPGSDNHLATKKYVDDAIAADTTARGLPFNNPQWSEDGLSIDPVTGNVILNDNYTFGVSSLLVHIGGVKVVRGVHYNQVGSNIGDSSSIINITNAGQALVGSVDVINFESSDAAEIVQLSSEFGGYVSISGSGGRDGTSEDNSFAAADVFGTSRSALSYRLPNRRWILKDTAPNLSLYLLESKYAKFVLELESTVIIQRMILDRVDMQLIGSFSLILSGSSSSNISHSKLFVEHGLRSTSNFGINVDNSDLTFERVFMTEDSADINVSSSRIYINAGFIGQLNLIDSTVIVDGGGEVDIADLGSSSETFKRLVVREANLEDSSLKSNGGDARLLVGDLRLHGSSRFGSSNSDSSSLPLYPDYFESISTLDSDSLVIGRSDWVLRTTVGNGAINTVGPENDSPYGLNYSNDPSDIGIEIDTRALPALRKSSDSDGLIVHIGSGSSDGGVDKFDVAYKGTDDLSYTNSASTFIDFGRCHVFVGAAGTSSGNEFVHFLVYQISSKRLVSHGAGRALNSEGSTRTALLAVDNGDYAKVAGLIYVNGFDNSSGQREQTAPVGEFVTLDNYEVELHLVLQNNSNFAT